MKRCLLYTAAILMLGSLYSCSEDSLDSQSVITVNQVTKNDFDKWIQKNYVEPYNIDFQYRLKDKETDMDYYLVPASYQNSIQMANLIKYLILDTFDQVGGPDFTKAFFPKMITLVGSFGYRNNGTYILGTAEGGLRITLYGVNEIDPTNAEDLNNKYFRTIYHEFGHILNQTKPYSTEFNQVSSSNYISDSWTSLSLVSALKKGFISSYASSEANEDFVELFSHYITLSQDAWDYYMSYAGEDGASIISQKMEIVYNYMKNTWGVDLDEMREIILEKQQNLPDVDLDHLN